MKLIFCADPLNPRAPDEMYQAEAEVAKALGFEYALVGYEALAVERDPVKAVRRVVVEPTPILGLYRGWMLKPGQYTQLYQALADKGILLINDPAAYRHCHYLPESYEVIRGQTPVSVWLKTAGGVDLDEMMALLQPFGSKPLILKDFVKSQKHYWREACFIPSASDREAVARIVTRFLELQGDDLNEGLVFREYVELEPLTTHSRGLSRDPTGDNPISRGVEPGQEPLFHPRYRPPERWRLAHHRTGRWPGRRPAGAG
jgi:hypothetical protein